MESDDGIEFGGPQSVDQMSRGVDEPAKAKSWMMRRSVKGGKDTAASDSLVGEVRIYETDAKDPTQAPVTFRDMFRFADRLDTLLLAIGTVGAAAGGAAYPLMGYLMGNSINGFYPVYDPVKVRAAALQYFYLAWGLFAANYLAYACYGIAAARQIRRIRAKALAATLHQELGWFDTANPNEVSSRIAGDTVIIEQGMGQKLGDMIKFTCQFFSGYIIGFIKGWKLTLVMLCALPLLLLTFTFLGVHMRKYTAQAQAHYARAGGVAEETFGAMRTVASLRAESVQADKFRRRVAEAEQWGLRGGYMIAAAAGSAIFVIFLTYSLGWWYGGYLLSHGDSQVDSVGSVVNVFFSVMMGSMAMAMIGPNVSAVLEARGAFQSIMNILRRVPRIGADMEAGTERAKLTGNISFRDVHFSYPSRPHAAVLSDFSLDIQSGQTVALVGASGSGKSTCIQLLQRFYDPTEGHIDVDGLRITECKLSWLRSQMGLVQQEPVLFQGTIAENIAWGAGDLATVSMDAIISAAQKANAHKFIMQFPDAYDTLCGEKGAQLSGGQKQRIAIARAIIREPNILLLDEATSALDTESERIVQEALDQLMQDKSRTCIVIAHRLSTIRNADLIVVFQGGRVVEQGKHDDLVARDGVYAQLVRIQLGQKQSDEEKAKEDANRTYELQVLQELERRSISRRQKSASQAAGSEPRASLMSTARESLTLAADKALSLASQLVAGVDEKGDPEKSVEAPPLTKWQLQRRVFALAKPQRPQLVTGVAFACVMGCTFPVMALFITNTINKMGLLINDPSALYDETSKFSLVFLGIAVIAGVSNCTMVACYRHMGEKLDSHLRDLIFTHTVRQDIGYFDMDENSTGAITARFATDATHVKAIAGENQGRQVQMAANVLCAVLIAFIAGSWQITLILICVLPALVLVGGVQWRAIGMGAKLSQQSVAESGKLATEAISNIRTVKAFGLERSLQSRYYDSLTVSANEGKRKSHIVGVAAGVNLLIMFSTYGLVFWYGGTLVGSGTITFDQCLKSLMAIMMAAWSLSATTQFLGDTTQAEDCARKIFSVQDRRPIIDGSSRAGIQPAERAQGHIDVCDVAFKYPSRPNQIILNGYNLSIAAGQTVALVGESGSGKSTLVSLVERFYDPLRGEVTLDGSDLRDLNVSWLRSQIGLVGQEPSLFTGTIGDNIRMGRPGATDEEVEEAARMANAHTFIMTFPDKYNTEVGERGAQLSGGQKQRIAIARAIIKNPPVLLLDEATSALDAESEKVVQEALDRLLAMQRRTTIIVAHRLSTIKQADLIAVHKGGKVVELGRHEELLRLNGEYAKLNRTQVRS